MRKLLFASALAIAFGVGAPTSAAADPILITLQGVNDPTLSAGVLLTYNAGTGELRLDITNTSASYDPRLTGFGFNLPLSVTGISSFIGAATGWDYLLDRDHIDTPGQFGFYDAAGLTGSNLNGGAPNLGIPIGGSYSFVFLFTGSSFSSLNESSFANLLAHDPSGNPNEDEQSLIARFQQVGADGEGSDVAIPTTVASVPEPTTLMLSGLGFLGLAAGLRRRPKAQS